MYTLIHCSLLLSVDAMWLTESYYSVTDVARTRSQIKPFSIQLPLSELFYQSNGKWTKTQGLWGSSLSPLSWLSYLHSPQDFYEWLESRSLEDGLRMRIFPHLHLYPTSCPPHPSALLRPFLRGKGQEGTKHSWFLVTHRGTLSALASFYPFLVPPLTRRVSLLSSIFSSDSFLYSWTVRSTDTE